MKPFMKAHLYIVLDLEPLSSRPLVDRKNLIDLMLVDRMFNCRFDSFRVQEGKQI